MINIPHPVVMAKTLRSNFKQLIKSWYIFFIQLPYIPEFVIRLNNFFMLWHAMDGTAIEKTFKKEEELKYKASWHQKGALQSMLNWYRASRYRTVIIKGKIEIPVMILWGENDRFLEKMMAKKSLEKCTNGELKIIEGATHWVHHEKPTMVNNLIGEFLKK